MASRRRNAKPRSSNIGKAAQREAVPEESSVGDCDGGSGDGNHTKTIEELQAEFEHELSWCIHELELGLSTQKPDHRQAKEAMRILQILRNPKAVKARKRQVMRATFGDYRQKMQASEKKMGANSKDVKVSITPVKASQSKAIFVKQSVAKSARCASWVDGISSTVDPGVDQYCASDVNSVGGMNVGPDMNIGGDLNSDGSVHVHLNSDKGASGAENSTTAPCSAEIGGDDTETVRAPVKGRVAGGTADPEMFQAFWEELTELSKPSSQQGGTQTNNREPTKSSKSRKKKKKGRPSSGDSGHNNPVSELQASLEAVEVQETSKVSQSDKQRTKSSTSSKDIKRKTLEAPPRSTMKPADFRFTTSDNDFRFDFDAP